MDQERNSWEKEDLDKMFNQLSNSKKETKLKSMHILDVPCTLLTKIQQIALLVKSMNYSQLYQLTKMIQDGRSKDLFLLHLIS